MGAASKAGDWAFKAFTLGLGVATIYLSASFSVNVYRGLSWHKAQSVGEAALVEDWFSASHTERKMKSKINQDND